MRKINKNQSQHDEVFHPFWLGLIMLFTVMILIGILCFLRKKCGLPIRRLLNCLCCNKDHYKTSKPVPTTSSYNRACVYIPPSSLSPNLYKLARNIPMSSLDRELSSQRIDSNEHNADDDVFSIIGESDHINTSLPQSNQELYQSRTCRTARQFYANMRHTTQCQTVSSIDSYNNETPSLPTNRSMKFNKIDKLKSFRTPQFFQSITNTN